MFEVVDKEIAEEAVENGVQFLRQVAQGENSSLSSRNKYRKIITNEMVYLKQNHPDSYVLKMDISDISLVLEK
jgi:hypothetical protein